MKSQISTIAMPIIIQFSIFLCLALIPTAFSLSFSMSPIRTSDGGNLNLTGDAYITNEGLQVTTNERGQASTSRTGRATYGELLHLWDKPSQKMADFSTHFSLVIDSSGRNDFGDGLAFFVAPYGSTTKPWSAGGGLGLGLENGTSVDSSSLETFVAVEFDTFPNAFIDPPYNGGSVVPHVGIDINSLASVNTTTWYNNVSAGWENGVFISYNSTTKLLRVDFVGIYNNLTRPGSLSYEVDLRNYLPEYVTVGFSASTGAAFQKNTVKSWNFSSTDVKSSNEKLPTPTPSPEPQISNNNKVLVIIGLSVGAPVFILAAVCVLCLLLRKNKQKKKKKYEGLEEEYLSDSAMDNEFEKGNGPRKFSYNELVVATNDFAGEQKLGEGGFGGVYKGFLEVENTYIAVKKVSKGSKQGRKEYAAEVKIISQLRHMNLVQLMGWCHQRDELLLVYEFMPNGSLDSHLFTMNSVLTWEMRYRIAQGLASALLYLHEEWTQYVVHRDIKSSNVMLDRNFNAKLGDFGLAQLVDHDKDLHSTIPAGTLGYMAPEYPVTGLASKETDIYSLGIVLLEIACGRRTIDHRLPNQQVVLVEWVWNLYGFGQLLDAADAKVDLSEYDAHKLERLMVMGLWCIHPDSSLRPSIRQVMQLLNSQDPLPTLSLTMLNPIYFTPRILTNISSGNITTSSTGSTSELLPK